jgi:AAA domain
MALTEKVKFQLEFIGPYSTFSQGKPKPIPMVVQGMLPQGGFSVLGAAPKNSKSSLSRYLAVCITKGSDFLGRGTEQGDVILASLEDPRQHTDNCLYVLGYDNTSENDGRIHILEKLPPAIGETIDLLGEALTRMPEVRVLVIDTLAKALRVKDLNEYMQTLAAIEQLKNLSRQFAKLNVFSLAHCKKVYTDDPFSMLLGSTALRGEPDTNIVLYKEGNQRIIATEGRVVKNIPPTFLEATVTAKAPM